MKQYCYYCRNEDQYLCLTHCDSYNKYWYEFSILKYIKCQFNLLWIDIKGWFIYYWNEIWCQINIKKYLKNLKKL